MGQNPKIRKRSEDWPGPKRKKKITSKGKIMPDSKEKRKQTYIQREMNARFQRKKVTSKGELMPDTYIGKSIKINTF